MSFCISIFCCFSHGPSGLAGLKMSTHAHFFRHAILTHKIAQTKLVIGKLSGFISRSVHARLQVSVCSSYDLFLPPVNIQTDIHTRTQTAFWPAYIKSSASRAKNFIIHNTSVTEVSSDVKYRFQREQFARSGTDWCRWHHVSSQMQTDTLLCALTHSCVRPANARCVRTQHAESLSVSLPKIQKQWQQLSSTFLQCNCLERSAARFKWIEVADSPVKSPYKFLTQAAIFITYIGTGYHVYCDICQCDIPSPKKTVIYSSYSYTMQH